MSKRSKIAAIILILAVLAFTGWFSWPSREPVYKGKRLSQWLDEYNLAGAMDKTEPTSNAIRAMGTNSLRFMLVYIKQVDSPVKTKLVALLAKQKLVRLPFYGEARYRSASILALRALDAEATPLCSDLLAVAQDPKTRWWGMMSLLAIGTNAVPTLEKACQSTNTQVRTQAVLMIAMIRNMPPPWFSWGWDKDLLSGRPLFSLGYAVGEEDVRGIARMLEHSNSAVRRASAEALGLYTLPPYAEVAKSQVSLLIQAVKDPSAEVQAAAAETLKKIDSQTAAKLGIR